MKPAKPYIRLLFERPNGQRSEAELEGIPVTSDMLDAAEDLLHTLTTGERPVIKNLYDLVALAFNTTREEAKERITAAACGMSPQKIKLRRRMTGQDRRRIADGDRALALPEPQSDDEVRAQLEAIYTEVDTSSQGALTPLHASKTCAPRNSGSLPSDFSGVQNT